MDATEIYDTEIEDFMLPTNFNNLVAAARSSVDTLRHIHYPAKNDMKRKRGGKKPGPSASTLRMILYHLPSGASLQRQRRFDKRGWQTPKLHIQFQ